MKRWEVTFRGGYQWVAADLWTVEHGSLVFREQDGTPLSAYAEGEWMRVLEAIS